MSNDVTTIDFGRPGKRAPFIPAKKTDGSGAKVSRAPIVAVPKSEVDMEILRREATNPSKKAWAAFAMRKRMIPWNEIADFLDYGGVAQVKAAVNGILAATASPEDTETLRQSIISGLEEQLRRSVAFASADAFEDEDGTLIPNDQRIAWHREVRQDYEMLARISGAQAAAQVQLSTPDAAELGNIVRQIRQARGELPDEADVLELEITSDGSSALPED